MVFRVHTLLRGFCIFLDGWGFVNAQRSDGACLESGRYSCLHGARTGKSKPAPFTNQGCGTRTELHCADD
jgi:hypothetical protein